MVSDEVASTMDGLLIALGIDVFIREAANSIEKRLIDDNAFSNVASRSKYASAWLTLLKLEEELRNR
jgi:hypothetical protein